MKLSTLHPLPIPNSAVKKKKRKKDAVAVTSSPTGHTRLLSPSNPPIIPALLSVCVSPRRSDLSLRSMHPCPIPDAEAHGEDGNNCPEQLYLSNGEVSRSFFPPPSLPPCFCAPASFTALSLCQTWNCGGAELHRLNIWYLHLRSATSFKGFVDAQWPVINNGVTCFLWLKAWFSHGLPFSALSLNLHLI